MESQCRFITFKVVYASFVLHRSSLSRCTVWSIWAPRYVGGCVYTNEVSDFIFEQYYVLLLHMVACMLCVPLYHVPNNIAVYHGNVVEVYIYIYIYIYIIYIYIYIYIYQ